MSSSEPTQTLESLDSPVSLGAAPILAILLALGVLGAWFLAEPKVEVTAPGLTRLERPLALPMLTLQRAEGPLAIPADLRGRWTLVSIGFASCPDICPTTLSTLAEGIRRAGEADVPAQVLFVSVDPERDTPARLQAYAAHFGPEVIAATGVDHELLRLTEPTGLFFRRDEARDAYGHYNVDHATAVLVLDPQARVTGVLSAHERDAESIAKALEQLREKSS